MDNLVTATSILNWIENQVKSKNPIPSYLYIEIAFKLNSLIQGEQEKLYLLEQEVAKIRNIALDGGESVSKAKTRVEATDDYRKVRSQRALVERILEAIRISKLHARMANDVMQSA